MFQSLSCNTTHPWTPGLWAGKWQGRCRSQWCVREHWGSRRPEWSSRLCCSFPNGPAEGPHIASAAESVSDAHRRWSSSCCHQHLSKQEIKGELEELRGKQIDEIYVCINQKQYHIPGLRSSCVARRVLEWSTRLVLKDKIIFKCFIMSSNFLN